MHVTRVVVVLLLVHLLCSVNDVCGTAQALADVKQAIDNLWDPVQLLYEKRATKSFRKAITKVLQSFSTIAANIRLLSSAGGTASEFQQFLRYTPPGHNLDLFRIIMKLLYSQSDRQRSDFTSLGGPHIRMYAFAILGRICNKLGDNDRKVYLYPRLLVTDPDSDFYDPLTTEVSGLEEGLLDDDPVDLKGPFFEAIETLEGQLYNFYNQWSRNRAGLRDLDRDQTKTMDAAMQNMLTVLDFIMFADDLITQYQVPNQNTPANYIYFMENNRILEVLELIADTPQNTRAKRNMKDYAMFLIETYYVRPAVAPVAPAWRWNIQVFTEREVAKFSPIK